MFPRILVGAGVPLDQWAAELGALTGQPWLQEWWLEIVFLLLAIVLSAVELWWEPVGRFWRLIKSRWTGEKGLVEPKVQHPEIERDLIVYDRNSHEVQIHRGDTSTVVQTIQLEPTQTFEGWKERNDRQTSISEGGGPSEFVPLHDAARVFYEEVRHTKVGIVAEWGQTPEKILDYCGAYIARNTQVFGCRPPSTKLEAIPALEAKNMLVVGGATELVSKYHKGVKYIELAISASEVDRVTHNALENWSEEEEEDCRPSETPEEPKPEVLRLEDALRWVIKSEDLNSKLGEKSDLIKAAIFLRQAARDGEIKIKGRREINQDGGFDRFDNTWEEIDREYWRTHEFTIEAVVKEGAHYAIPETTTITPGNLVAEQMPAYSMLRVRREELETKWPKGST